MQINKKYLTKNKLPLSFYQRDTFEVARELLGKYLVSNINDQLVAGKIVEIEPYLGTWDRASHSYPYKKTPRTEIQFADGGVAYVYFVYGMYYQFCIVTETEGIPNVILVRALEPVYNLEAMQQRRGDNVKEINLTNGPGKLCIALGIDKSLYGESLIGDKLWLADNEKVKEQEIVCSARIGIDYAGEFAKLPWRLYIKDNEYVSKQSSKTVSWKKARLTFNKDLYDENKNNTK